MLILGQNGDVMVNVERIHTITTYQLGNYENGKLMEKRFRILAWYGSGEDDCWGIGDYTTEDRAKEVVREIWRTYGCFSAPEKYGAYPLIYEMPKE